MSIFKLPNWVPRPYQKKGVAIGIKNSTMGLLWSPGLGKTTAILEIYRKLKKKGLVDAMYVVAPLKVCLLVWPLQIKEWSNFKDLKVIVLHGTKKDQLVKDEADIYVMTPDAIKWMLNHTNEIYENSMLVIDESTKFKHSNTKRFKYLKQFIKYFDRRYILTGSPIPNGMLDLFGQIYILDEGATLGRYITHYRNKYFYSSGFGGYTFRIIPGMDKQILKDIKPIVHRLDAKDHLSLPDLVVKNIEVELPPKVKVFYKELEKEMIAEINDKKLIANNAAVVSSKCRQIANGGVYIGDGKEREIKHLHDEKTNACIDLVEELSGENVAIAYDTKHDLERLQKAFKVGKVLPPHIGGGVPSKSVIQIEKDWNLGSIPVLLLQPASTAHGLNLQKGGHVIIWHSLTFNLEHYEQLYQRFWRQGQTETTYMYHIITKGTVDATVLRALRHKDVVQKSALEYLKDEYKK